VIGRVALVGAGPGDPDLLTVRAVRRLGEADLVLYDALSSPELRKLAPEARWFFVGKRAGRESIAQEAINRILVREARRGQQVVRLKCGDPFVFGRGGEEALALVEAGIPFDVVPGVSSAIAAPALVGIPITHRGLASGFTVVAGHAESAYGPIVDGLTPGSVTLVVLMGLAAREPLVGRLLARGWPAETPAAIVLGAATPQAWRWTGRLDALAAVALPPSPRGDEPPGILVVGGVAALAEALAPRLAPEASAAEAAAVIP
jgi:uroporphyrin-III C-methyltransferase/precorrin-2 dehydrogenase/sirohydrochlorin ferrochelatase